MATDRIRRGEDRAHIAWTNGAESGGTSIWFDKETRTRAQQDAIVSAIVLNAIARAIEVDGRLEIAVNDAERINEFD